MELLLPLRRYILAFLLLGVFGMTGCINTSTVVRIFPTDFPKISHRPGPVKVTAEVCGSGSLLGFRLTKGPNILSAVQKAIASAGPGYNGLSNVEIHEQFHGNILMNYSCFIVVALPVRIGQAGLPKQYVPASRVPSGTEENQWDF